jgi:hypothetical protein
MGGAAKTTQVYTTGYKSLRHLHKRHITGPTNKISLNDVILALGV